MEPGARPEAPPQDSSWRFLGCGCGVLVLLGFLAFAFLTWRMYRQGQDFEAAMKDPAERAARTRELLPWHDLPAGYHPGGALSVPFAMDMAILSDEEPKQVTAPDGHWQPSFRERGFLYVRMRALGNQGELRSFVEGKGPEPAWFQKSELRLHTRETFGHGRIEASDAPDEEILYSANRGTVELQDERQEGLFTLLLIDCPQDEKVRIGIWFAPDPGPAAYVGTPADPEAIQRFAGHFRFCPTG